MNSLDDTFDDTKRHIFLFNDIVVGDDMLLVNTLCHFKYYNDGIETFCINSYIELKDLIIVILGREFKSTITTNRPIRILPTKINPKF